MLLVILATAGVCADLDAMIYRPEKGAMWDPSILWHNGKYHAFMMYSQAGRNGLDAGHCLLATSTDGVHWQTEGPVNEERERAAGNKFFKCFVGRCGNRFIMDHGVARPGGQDMMRFYESTDLRSWSYLSSNSPDPRWYGRPPQAARWDHMYILPKEEGNPAAGYWGHVVAVPKPGDPPGVGMMESADGRTWTVLPPAPMLWPQGMETVSHFEYGGCERLNGKYYLIGGYGGIQGFKGYSMFTLVADHPRGPFRPDVDAFRLCGSSSQNVAWLAAWCRGDGELLISNYASSAPGDLSPWLLPLRKPIIDLDGHLRLAWWPGNERLKGDALPLKETVFSLRSKDGSETYDTVWLDTAFDLQSGVILEGTLRGTTAGEQPAAGLVFDEGNEQSMAVLLGLGLPEARQTHVGRLVTQNGESQFDSEDVTGKCSATVTGLDPGREHHFRLLLRLSLFEFYVDDRLMQTHAYRPASGRLGFVARKARLDVRDLKAWRMSLAADKSFALSRPRAVTVRNKTLVAWVAPATLDQSGGSALTLEGPNDLFDGLVFGERAPHRWMAGSDGFRRTCADQSGWPQETADARTFVQIALVYRGRQATLFRNGEIYADYTMPGEPAAFGPDDTVLIGLRHLRAAGSAWFAGVVEDARIYDRAMTAEQIASLKPDQPSDPKPWAWWTFENGQAQEVMNTFPAGELFGNARVEGGRLLLDGQESYAVFRRTAAPKILPQQEAGLYHPPGMSMWDTWYLQRGDETHVFHLQNRRDHARRSSDHESIGHAVSRDLIHWKELPVALRKGPKGSYDDSWALFTGCAVEHSNRVYLLYCGNHQPGDRCRQSMCLATSPSQDGVTFTRYAGNPIIEPDPQRYYSIHEPPAPFKFHAWPHIDCRDLAVVKDPGGDGWLGYVMMRRKGQTDAFHSACIALCRSKDLLRWEVGDPCCTPNRFNCFEVPDVFKLGAKWYLIALTGDGYGQSKRWSDPEITCATVVFQADRPEGPFEEVRENLLLASTGSQGYSARTVERNGERLMFYTRPSEPHARLAWPAKLAPRAEGGLNPVYWPGLDKAFAPPQSHPAVELDAGKESVLHRLSGLSSKGSTFMITATAELKRAKAAGFAFGQSEDKPGFVTEISTEGGSQGQVSLANLPGSTIQNRHWPIQANGVYRLRVIVVEQMVDVYVDDILVLNRCVPELCPGSISLTARGGAVTLKEVQHYSPIP